MNVEFKVHGVSNGSTNVATVVDGEDITASVPCLEVELVTTSDRSGNLTLRFVGSSIAEARELFGKDAVLTASFAAKA